MAKIGHDNWESVVVSPETVVAKIKPRMSIFLGTAVAEPRTMVRHLMTSDAKNLEDLELIQLVSFGDAVSLRSLRSQNFRLKTFFSGWVASEAIEEGQGRIIAEARYIKIPGNTLAEAVFVVDEKYQQLGIATMMFEMLVGLARERGIKGFVAEVLFSNIGMMKVFKKGQLPVKARLESSVYHLEIPF